MMSIDQFVDMDETSLRKMYLDDAKKHFNEVGWDSNEQILFKYRKYTSAALVMGGFGLYKILDSPARDLALGAGILTGCCVLARTYLNRRRLQKEKMKTIARYAEGLDSASLRRRMLEKDYGISDDVPDEHKRDVLAEKYADLASKKYIENDYDNPGLGGKLNYSMFSYLVMVSGVGYSMVTGNLELGGIAGLAGFVMSLHALHRKRKGQKIVKKSVENFLKAMELDELEDYTKKHSPYYVYLDSADKLEEAFANVREMREKIRNVKKSDPRSIEDE